MTGVGIRRIRRELGLTQEEFAKTLGVQRLAVTRWETGARKMSEPITRLVRLLHAGARGTARWRRKGRGR